MGNDGENGVRSHVSHDYEAVEDTQQPVEGVDYYREGAYLVFTAHYLRERGFCCRSGCRHCPYGFREGEGDGAASSPRGE